jgi:hypothetical protein
VKRQSGRRSLLPAVALAALLAVVLQAPPSWAAGDELPQDVPLFTISKSQNKNQVQFAVRLDGQCAPLGEQPVFAYWRMLEKSPVAIESLLPIEQRAYGIKVQVVTARGAMDGNVELRLRALPDRRIVVRSYRARDGCGARAEIAIEGAPANLYNVHAMLRWPFGIARIYVSGWSVEDLRLVRETVHS